MEKTKLNTTDSASALSFAKLFLILAMLTLGFVLGVRFVILPVSTAPAIESEASK
ncbi:MAG: hypothetical protein ACK5RO_11175 [Pseudobdellovibrionaceae bacterium]